MCGLEILYIINFLILSIYFGTNSVYNLENGKGDENMKKIAVISDLSGLGKCSLSAALPVISAAGAQCCPITTAVLTNQTGYDSYFCRDLTDTIDNYTQQWDAIGFVPDAVLTGYMASEEQIDKVITLVKHYKEKGRTIIVDPVMADDGELYKDYSRRMCIKMQELCAQAKVITPNLSELCILCGISFNEISSSPNIVKRVEKAAAGLLNDVLKLVVVTGIFTDGCVYTMTVGKDKTYLVKNKKYSSGFSGTGDIFSALFTVLYIKGFSVKYCLNKTVRFIMKSVKKTKAGCSYSPDGTDFEHCLKMLTKNKITKR